MARVRARPEFCEFTIAKQKPGERQTSASDKGAGRLPHGKARPLTERPPPCNKRPVPLSDVEWHEIDLSEPENIRAGFFGTISNFPSLFAADSRQMGTISNFPSLVGANSIRKVRKRAKAQQRIARLDSSVSLTPQNGAEGTAPVTRAAWRAGDWGSAAGRRRRAGWLPPRRRRSEAWRRRLRHL